MRLPADADDLAVVLARVWEDLPHIMADIIARAAASGLVLVPLWGFLESEVTARLWDVCPCLVGCSVEGSSRYLGE